MRLLLLASCLFRAAIMSMQKTTIGPRKFQIFRSHLFYKTLEQYIYPAHRQTFTIGAFCAYPIHDSILLSIGVYYEYTDQLLYRSFRHMAQNIWYKTLYSPCYIGRLYTRLYARVS